MKRINSTGILSGLLTAGLLVAGCTGDDTTATGTDTDDTTDGGDTVTPTTMPGADSTSDGGVDSSDDGPMDDTTTADDDSDSSSGDGPPDPVPVMMALEITNVSGDAAIFSPVSPGVWLNHEQDAELIFPEDMPDPGEGLEELAEDGIPTMLAAALKDNAGHLQSGIFDTPEGGSMGPLAPGETYRVEFLAEPFSRLSLAMMLVGSNDQIIATGTPGIGMFAGGGQPQGVRDVTNLVRVWDAGTEVNQGPSQGPWQALHGGSPNMGAPEAGGVFPHNDSTRAIPLPVDLISVEILQGDGVDTDEDEYTIRLTNTSFDSGVLVTPFSDLFWMTHDDTVSMFETGSAASAEIESLAEDGVATGLAAAFPAGVGGVGLADTEAGPFVPGDMPASGDTIEFVVNTSNVTPLLSFATMVVQSNDAFLAPPATGIALYDEDGNPRDNDDIEEDIRRLLTVWDAGTEANETPGVGPNQVLQQGGELNLGPDDALDEVRIYQDEGSDLDGDSVNGVMAVSIVADTDNPGDFIVRIENTSALTGYPATLTPAFYMVHNGDALMFELGSLASPGLESLAEDGATATIVGEWDGDADVLLATTYDQPENAAMDVLDPGPLAPGEFYEFTITADATDRYFSFAQMIVPSNDTFVAFGDEGIALFDSQGAQRTDEAIAADIDSMLEAWDAGTEANQAGAAGRDQPPRQEMDNTGLDNGPGTIRVHENSATNEIVWSAPRSEQVVRVMLGPVE